MAPNSVVLSLFRFAAVSCIVALTLMAAACGGGSAATTPPPSSSAAPSPPALLGAFDSASNASDGGSTVPQFGTASACGWAASSASGAPVAQVLVSIDGQVIGSASTGFARPDVQASSGRKDFLNSGWCHWFDLGALSTGSHRIDATAYDGTGASLALAPPRFISVAQAAASNPDSTLLISNPVLESAVHQPLSEQYIWTGSADPALPGFFRSSFVLSSVPASANLFVTGGMTINVFVNGQPVASVTRGTELIPALPMLATDVSQHLQLGRNIVAVEVANGARFAAKLMTGTTPATATPALISDAQWKSATAAPSGWEQTGFDDSAWSNANSLGGIESRPDFFEGNADLEMYAWPGYDGISPYLAHARVFPALVRNISYGKGNLPDPSSLTAASIQRPAVIDLPPAGSVSSDFPSFMLDFGRDIGGRLELQSNSPQPVSVQLQFGESAQEALGFPYLGTRALTLQPGITAYGPKTAFRFAWVKLVSGPPLVTLSTLDADQIYYPVSNHGSFQSSDPALDRISALSVYTAHVSMQDRIWDAPKRDRSPFAGDLFVTARTIRGAFGESIAVQRTLDALSQAALSANPPQDINNIPGYSPLWVAAQADHYRWSGDFNYLQSIGGGLLKVLGTMESQLDSTGLFQAPAARWFIFVDWSPGLYLNDPEALEGNDFEYYLGFTQGAWLLRQLGDPTSANHYQAVADKMRTAIMSSYYNSISGTFGSRWQLNAIAVVSGLADSTQASAVYTNVLSKTPTAPVSPYFAYFGLEAMANAGHRSEALQWLRQYWGGMMALGGTSFWEIYDPGWSTLDIYAAQRDWFNSANLTNTDRYFVSLAHGWASGPAPWLQEQVLGITPVAPGYQQVMVRPDLAGLTFARGTQATALGDISVDISNAGHTLNLTVPPSMQVSVSMPITSGQTTLQVNGQAVAGTAAEGGSRLLVVLPSASVFLIQSH